MLERLELVRLDLAVGDVRLDAVAFAQRVGELAQAPDALGEHDHLLLAGDAGERLRGDPAQQRQAIAAAADRVGDEPLADERFRERRLRVRERLRINRLASTYTPTLPRTTPWARESSASACLNSSLPASSVLSSRRTSSSRR